ncbi:hypothetical protein PV382_23410 [Streptomyces scabiei]|uniref:hypothetical protein n=1 Tax=Streptomyces scabiei TaxID=1930 RepID=UPI000765CB24|nr:hypothetical protein [Streptomyces scabiei]MDX2658365.1 hypothetical protein [Streptomyces scabiei]MDX2870521.1 hypothetical protein [Streptomyces scabiei]MDX2999143.1 hypothetical protein [Streptomyces scabiei]MDX3048706.1 hypothetical protein [Streptomyces scabiei]MDX3175201.1 hypothetical protein [Streptomyces scabiei]
MRLTLTSGETTVDLRTDPGEAVSLRAAENAALRLFRALPKASTDADEEQPFGFSLSSDTERSPEPAPVEDEDDE